MTSYAPKKITPTPVSIPISSTTAAIPLGEKDSRYMIVFTGSNVGSITVTGVVPGGDKDEAVTNGTINLATTKFVYIQDVPLESIKIAYSTGVLALYYAIYAYPNRG